MLATVLGFTAAMVLGTAIAAALWWWNQLYKVLDPYLVVANAMPKTAFVPIFYIWLGATLSIYGMSLAISLFITILMIYSGFQGIDPNKVKLAQTFGASKGQILTKVVLPGSVPTLIAALKVNAGLSLVGVVVGEFQSASLGLGYLIQYGSQIFKMNIVMTAITILAIVSSRDVSRDLVAGSRGDAPALARAIPSGRRIDRRYGASDAPFRHARGLTRASLWFGNEHGSPARAGGERAHAQIAGFARSEQRALAAGAGEAQSGLRVGSDNTAGPNPGSAKGGLRCRMRPIGRAVRSCSLL